MTELREEMVCGFAFEELSEDEMMEVDGGTIQTASAVVAATSLPCGVGASIATIGVSVWWFMRK